MRFMHAIWLGLGLLPLLAMTVGAQESHPFGVRDLVGFDRVSDPQISPDGRLVAFVVSAVDLDANKRRTDLWLSGIDGPNGRRLTQHEANDSSPRWSPDGRWIFFLSARSKSSQIWRIAPDGGEAQPVTALPLDVGSFTFSPDGTSIALGLEVFPGLTIDETKKRLDEIAAAKSTGRIYDRLLFRHWDAWSDGRRSHVFVMPAAGGQPVDVMKAMDADAPPKPFGGDEEYTFTPDGKGVVFSAKDVGREEAWSTNFDLWLAN